MPDNYPLPWPAVSFTARRHQDAHVDTVSACFCPTSRAAGMSGPLRLSGAASPQPVLLSKRPAPAVLTSPAAMTQFGADATTVITPPRRRPPAILSHTIAIGAVAAAWR